MLRDEGAGLRVNRSSQAGFEPDPEFRNSGRLAYREVTQQLILIPGFGYQNGLIPGFRVSKYPVFGYQGGVSGTGK